jgi:CRISPR/Cas system-associated exonuclease Cas4 (RecB family)
MRTIRASEFGTYIYCQRAWWYHKIGVAPENKERLASGLALHSRHAHMVARTGYLRAFAYTLLLIAIVICAVYITLQLV